MHQALHYSKPCIIMLYLITDEFIFNEEDDNRSLYLCHNNFNNTTSLCVSGNMITLCIGVTSMPEYTQWLIDNHKSLLLINKENWFKSKFNNNCYDDFHYMLLAEIKELILKTEWK